MIGKPWKFIMFQEHDEWTNDLYKKMKRSFISANSLVILAHLEEKKKEDKNKNNNTRE